MLYKTINSYSNEIYDRICNDIHENINNNIYNNIILYNNYDNQEHYNNVYHQVENGDIICVLININDRVCGFSGKVYIDNKNNKSVQISTLDGCIFISLKPTDIISICEKHNE